MNELQLATIEALTPIWQRVLQRSLIKPDDDFFELGGNFSLAGRLFAAIAQEFGQTVPPTTICSAPTIATLAARLRTSQPHSPLVLLKAGSQGPPVFMTHGMCSSVVQLVPLARRMQVTQPIYGIEARGNDGLEEPFDRIEDMARFHLRDIREVQPTGPYLLLGYSFGGLVALEVARQLREAGSGVSLLAMLDAYPHRHQLSLGEHAQLVPRLVRHRLIAYMQRHGRSRSAIVNASDLSDVRAMRLHTQAMQRIKNAHSRALRHYRPRFYDGPVKFVRAAAISHFPHDPVRVWSPLVRTLEVETVPGDHLGMLTTGVETLARVAARYVKEATDAGQVATC